MKNQHKSYIVILLVNRLPRMMNKTLLTNDARVNRIRIAIHPFFLSLCIQLRCNLLRDALPFFLILRPRISFQRGIPQVCCLS